MKCNTANESPDRLERIRTSQIAQAGHYIVVTAVARGDGEKPFGLCLSTEMQSKTNTFSENSLFLSLSTLFSFVFKAAFQQRLFFL